MEKTAALNERQGRERFAFYCSSVSRSGIVFVKTLLFTVTPMCVCVCVRVCAFACVCLCLPASQR